MPWQVPGDPHNKIFIIMKNKLPKALLVLYTFIALVIAALVLRTKFIDFRNALRS